MLNATRSFTGDAQCLRRLIRMLLDIETKSVPFQCVNDAIEAIIRFWPVTWLVLVLQNRRRAFSRAGNKTRHECLNRG